MKSKLKKSRISMKPEYDFSKGVRGKYFKRYHSGSNVIILAPELKKVFPNSDAVNQALRELMKVAKRSVKVASL